MSRRCLIISYYFPPSGGGGVQRITKLTKYLHHLNWRVTVITAEENASTVPQDTSLLQEVPDEIEILRIKSHIPGGGKHHKIRIPNYLQRWISAFLYIPDSRKKWSSSVLEKIKYEAENGAYDLVLASSPPFSIVLLAAELQQTLTIPVILDMRDHWTTYPFKIYPTPYHYFKDKRLERNAIQKIKYGVSAYKSLLSYFSNHIKGFKTENWRHIPNGYDEEDFENLAPAEMDGKFFNIAFLGTFYSHINSPEYFFKALAVLNKKEPQAGGKLRFHHVGKSMVDLIRLAKRYNVHEQIVLHGYLDHKKSLAVLKGMDAFLLTLDAKKPYSGNTIGGKVYEYLRMGKPILLLGAKKGEASDLVNKCDAGEVVSTHETDKIVKILIAWILHPPKFTYKNISEYRRDRQAAFFAEFMEKVILDDL